MEIFSAVKHSHLEKKYSFSNKHHMDILEGMQLCSVVTHAHHIIHFICNSYKTTFKYIIL